MNKIESLFDHHLHSAFSEDSEEPYEGLVKDAIARGKRAFATTEHTEILYADEMGKGYFCADIHAYNKKVLEMQEKYPEIQILRAAEVGYEADYKERIQAFIDKNQFDYVIFSIHSVSGYDIGEAFYTGKVDTERDVVAESLNATYDALQNLEGVHILGHIDFLLRYVHEDLRYQYLRHEELLRAIFETLVKRGIALEINTAAWRKNLDFFHPHDYLLDLYVACGGEMLTLGSDAHNITQVNFGFERALHILDAKGITTITTFETGKPKELSVKELLS